MNSKISIILCTLMLITFPFSQTAKAVENKGFPFLVQPNYPDNHMKGTTYFNLNAKKDSKQTISVTLTNRSDRPITVDVGKANALTAKNGGIHYTKEKGNETMRFTDKAYALKDMMKIEDEKVSLKAGQSKEVKVHIELPKKAKGIYLGGLLFSSEEGNETQKEETDKGVGIQIESRAEFALAIQLNLEDKEKISFEFGEGKAIFTPSGLIASFEMKNKNATITNIEELHYTILNKKGDILRKEKAENVKMAPKTEIDYSFLWDGKVAEGDYIFKLKAKIGDETIEKEVPFTIKKETIEKIKELESENNNIVVEGGTNWPVLIIAMILASAVTYFLVIRKKRKKDESGQK